MSVSSALVERVFSTLSGIIRDFPGEGSLTKDSRLEGLGLIMIALGLAAALMGH
jgi:hypothetical protein